MGHKDLVVLDQVKQITKQLEKENNWGFTFVIDSGNYETGIVFHHETRRSRRRVESEDWDNVKYPEEMKCPDLLDYRNKIIIEYEEEPKPGKRGGKLGHKGHTEESKKDSNRDNLYHGDRFRVFKVWESEFKKLKKSNGSYEWESKDKEKIFKLKLWKFFCDCFTNRI